MPQNEYIELHQKRFGRRFDAVERERKKAARVHRVRSKQARRLRGIKAKLQHQQQHVEKVSLRKRLLQHQAKNAQQKKQKGRDDNDNDDDDHGENRGGALPSYLLDRDQVQRTKVLSNMVKQKRKEKAGKWTVPLQKVQALREDEMFKVLRTGKRKRKMWKRMVHKVCFVGQDFTRKPPKLERYVRPSGLRFTKAHVTHPELKATFYLDIVGVKKNPQSQLYTSLGVITKGTILEVNVSDLGLVTQTGKVVWAKYAQVTNNPELDGCINAVLLV